MKPLLLLLLLLLAVSQVRAGTDRAVVFGLSESVLRIEVQRVQGGFSLGTGVVVAQGKRALLLADGTNVVRVTPDT